MASASTNTHKKDVFIHFGPYGKSITIDQFYLPYDNVSFMDPRFQFSDKMFDHNLRYGPHTRRLIRNITLQNKS